MTDELERIIRPIVEGQIRGFLKEHPLIVEAVDWFKPSKDKTMTFINSLAKRIVRDLTCASTNHLITPRVIFRVWQQILRPAAAGMASWICPRRETFDHF